MTISECAAAARDGLAVKYRGSIGRIANITKAGKIQIVYPGDRRPRIGVDAAQVEVA